MSIKMSENFNLPVNIYSVSINYMDDNIFETEAVQFAINNHDALVEALEWSLERAAPVVKHEDKSMDQMMLIRYQTLLQELK